MNSGRLSFRGEEPCDGVEMAITESSVYEVRLESVSSEPIRNACVQSRNNFMQLQSNGRSVFYVQMARDEIVQIKVLVVVPERVLDLFGHLEQTDVAEHLDDGADWEVDVDSFHCPVAWAGVLAGHDAGEKVRVRRQSAHLQ